MRRQRRKRGQERSFRRGQRLDERGPELLDERSGRRLSVRRKQPRDKPLAVQIGASGQVDDDLQPLVEPAARFARAAERVDKPCGINGHDADRARADDALRRLDPGDRRACGQGVEIVDDENKPVRRAGRRPLADPLGKRRQKRSRRRRGNVAGVEEIRPGRTGRRFPTGAPGRGFRALRGGVRFRGQGCNALIETRHAILQIAAPVAHVQSRGVALRAAADSKS